MVQQLNKLYSAVRAIHLYLGLLISPFVLIFGISILVLNHSSLVNRIFPVRTLPVLKTKLEKIPQETTELGTAKRIISDLDIRGEIDFITRTANSISFPVNKPGLSVSAAG